MADEAAYLRAVAQFVPAAGADSAVADDLAVAGSARARGGSGGPAHAESTHHNERAVSQYDQRREWTDGAGDRARDSERRAGSLPAGGVARSPHQGEPGRNRAQFGRDLAGEVLFELQQAVEQYDFCYKQIRDCAARLQQYLAQIPSHERSGLEATEASGSATASHDSGKGKKKKAGRKKRQNEPDFDLEGELTRICGVRLTAIEGVDVTTVQTWVAELGVDLSAWPSEDHLVSWLNLSPKRQISGGKLIKHEHSRAKNRVANALRMAATSLFKSDSYLGARFRSLRGRLGPGKAVKAMAAHLARLIYRMLKHGQAWVDRGAAEHEQRRQQREQAALERKASALGFRLVPAA